MKKSLLINAASFIFIGGTLIFAPTASAQHGQAMKVDPSRGVMTIAPLLERVTPAVVNISVSSKVKVKTNQFSNDEFIERFFGKRGEKPDQKSDKGEANTRTQRSVGSGIIVNAGKGYILTNHHVIDGADKITVTLKDRRTAIATLIGSDPATDVALLEIDLRGLTDMPFAKSSKVKVGDYVVAIGNSFGIGQSVTSGIVSALGRSDFSSRDKYQDYIQTDAAINQGNSGGALINSKGQLVGMNTAILSRSGGSNGIGFAVPTDMITNVMNQIISYGEVRRGRIGVNIQNITPELMEAMNLKDRNGALISKVVDKSAAERAGLKSGDVIIRFNDVDILDATDIRNAVGYIEPGKRASISYLRGGRRYTTKISVDKMPDEEKDDVSVDDIGEESEIDTAVFQAFDGASFSAIPKDLDPEGGDNGVLIINVKRNSNAWEAGLRKGDIVRSIDNHDVKSLRDFKTAIAKKKGAHFLSVQKPRGQVFIAVK